MSRRCFAVLLCLLLLSAVPVAGASRAAIERPQATGSIAPEREFMGMVIRDPWYDFNTNPLYPNGPNRDFQDTMGATLARAGVQWVRLDFHIVGDNAEAEIAKNDYFINEVAPRHNLKVLALLSFDLLQGVDAHLLNTGPFTVTSKFGGGVNQYMDTWLTRGLMIADRYGDRIAAYELLNEQNRLPRYTPGGKVGDAIKPNIVGRLITKFYRFCRYIEVPVNEPVHGCFNAKIIMGGLHPRGSEPSELGEVWMSDAQYLEAIYSDPSSFKGFKDNATYYPVDGIGYHPYPEEIRLSPNDVQVDRGLQRMREVLNRFDPDKQFWITEVGYNVGFDFDGPIGDRPAQTEAGQALFMRDVYTSLEARQLPSGLPEIANVFWFKYEDFPPAAIVYDSKGNPIAYPQSWGIVRIPFTEDNACPGGACYHVGGTPGQYRLAFLTYRELAGLPVYQTMLPDVKR